MFEIKAGKRIQNFENGVLYTFPDRNYYSGYSISDDGAWLYKIGGKSFDRENEYGAFHEAILHYEGKQFTSRIFRSDAHYNERKLFQIRGGNYLALLYQGDTVVAKYGFTAGSYGGITDLTATIIKELLTRYSKDSKQKERADQEAKAKEASKYENIGKEVRPEVVELEEENIELSVSGSSIQEKFISIVGEVSELTQQINQSTMLGDNKDIVESFIKAKDEIEKLTSAAPEKVSTFFGKYFGSNKYIQKALKSAKDIKTENDSIQKNINHLFGIIHTKYEKLVETGHSLQKTKSLLTAQIEALTDLAEESNAAKAKYKSQLDVPMNELRLNTQINASVEKYENRLAKIDSAIMATQTTIIALGKELPAMKTDLTDEMAIGSLLSNVDDYQHMFQEIAELVSGVAKSTAEQTHTVIENLLDMQINDTYTTQYLADQTERSKKFGAMITDKSQKLAIKVQHDADFIASIAKGNTLEHTRKTVKMLKE